jgi:hypothetical protein
MPELIRPVLLVSQGQPLQLFAADSACSGCATPCRSASPAPTNAVSGELVLQSSVLNRLALAFFGVPLVLLGALIWSLQAVADDSATPMILIVGLIAACVVGGNVAKRILPEVDRALKASGVIPNIE